MNLVRDDLTLSAKGKRFPLKDTYLAIYSATVNTRRTLAEVLQTTFPWCSEWEVELKGLFLAYVEAKQAARWYEQQMDRLFDDAVVRPADIQQLARIAATYPSRERFLTELTHDPPDTTGDGSGAPLVDKDCLDLSTIRSAKGREWSTVSILNVVDGCLRTWPRAASWRSRRNDACFMSP